MDQLDIWKSRSNSNHTRQYAFSYTLSKSANPIVFQNACYTLEQHGSIQDGILLEDVDGSLIQYYRLNNMKIRIECDVEVDAVYIDSQIYLSDILKEMDT